MARQLPGPYGIEELADDVLNAVDVLSLSRYVLAGQA
jgi:hypothetical protein